jgi:hypothetical protein
VQLKNQKPVLKQISFHFGEFFCSGLILKDISLRFRLRQKMDCTKFVRNGGDGRKAAAFWCIRLRIGKKGETAKNMPAGGGFIGR